MLLSNGYVKIYRSLLDWEWYGDLNTKTLFIHLLLTANYEPKKWQGIVIERGQKVTSFAALATETSLTIQEIRTAIKRLKSTCEITCVSSSKFTVVTVKNYHHYQDDNMQANKRTTNEQQTINNNERKIKKDKKDILPEATSSSSKIIIELPLNDNSKYPVLDEQVEKWKSLYPAVDILQELRKMDGWCDANPKQRKTRKGIMRFINNWLSRTQDKGAPQTEGRKVLR